jgi:hypothetical protein
LRHHGRVRLLFLELCEKWYREPWERYLLHCVMHVNKTREMNKNLNPLIRKFLVFEKYLLMPSQCDSLFS